MRSGTRWPVIGAVVASSLAVATAVVAVLELGLGAENASSVYLVAVVACALTGGTLAAIAAAIGSFLVYNYVFTVPRFTFQIDDPGVLVSVVVLLFVGIVVGQLAARERARAETARAREQEARTMFGVSRVLATRSDTESALAQIVRAVRDETGMTRVWVALGPTEAAERVAADSGTGAPPPQAALVRVLQRRPGDEPAQWSLIHRSRPGRHAAAGDDMYRVRIEASDEPLGSVWAVRSRGAGPPDTVQTRLLAAVADQVGQALARDRAAEEQRAAEVARQSDALKSALLQSVSHDFRTPLATIRAAAGSSTRTSGRRPRTAERDREAIEREVEYLNRLVTNLLDLSRIEAGALRADRDVFELEDLVERALVRVRTRCRRPQHRVRHRARRGPGRPGLPRRGRDQHPRQRPAGTRPTTVTSGSPRRHTTGWSGCGRGRRGRRPGRGTRADLREVLPRPGDPAGPAVGLGIGLAVVRGLDGGDGRPRSTPSARHSAGSRSISTCPAAEPFADGGGVVRRRSGRRRASSSSRTTRRHVS